MKETAFQKLKRTISEYNSSVNEMSKFSFSEKESELFVNMMDEYLRDHVVDTINLNNLTQLELLDLDARVKVQLDEYHKRDKIKVFRLSIFGNNTYFKTAEDAKKELDSHIEEYDFEEMVSDEELKVTVDYMNSSEVEKWCR